ncbi:MAG: class I SAM-dependent methyltransferase [Verrucomicrobia bacterium]|nr:class I SAM-dependent methyltransferase [Verrucomicrobiota bacterium]
MTTLKLLPREEYRGVNNNDPIRFYYWPVFGRLYRRRVELCLGECRGGERVLEVGFGSGLTFVNLHEAYREIHGLDLTADCGQVAGLFQRHGIATRLTNGNVLRMPYPDNHFDTVLLISILEHLRPEELEPAFREIRRVLKPGGQVVYGVPVERPLMVFLFRVLGYKIRDLHFSTEQDVAAAADRVLTAVRCAPMRSVFGQVYEVGHLVKPG